MEGLMLLGVLVVIAALCTPIIAIIAFARAGDARRRVEALEFNVADLRARLARGESMEADPAAAAPSMVPPEAVPLGMPPAQQAPYAPPPQPYPQQAPYPGTAAAPPPVAAPGTPWAPPPLAASTAAPPLSGDIPPPFPPGPPAPPVTPPAGGGRSSLERKLGANLFVWLGAIALALSALFLVRYAIDAGYLSPAVRLTLAALFGAGLIAVGEKLRAKDARIGQALAAAGVAALFGTLFAAVGMYKFLDPLTGGVLATALTAGAVLLALRHGPFVAALGFVGGVLSPIFLGSEAPNVPVLFGYLLAISAGTLWVIRLRGWWWLGWGVLAGDVIWSLAWMFMRLFGPTAHRGELIWVGLFQVAVAGLFVWATWRRVSEEGDAPAHVVAKVWAATLTTGALLVFGIAGDAANWTGWLCLLLHAGGIYALARYVPRFQWLAVAPMILSLAAFALWHGALWFDWRATQTETYARTIVVVAGLLAAGAYALMWNAGRPGFWAALSAGAAFLHFVLAYFTLRNLMPDATWGLISLGLALPYVAAAERLARWRHSMAGANEALGMVAVGATFFIAAAVPFELRREWITVAYALELPAVAWIAWKLDLPILRRLCWILVAIVSIRLVANPYVLDYPLGSVPVFNWILYAYGVSAAAFYVGGWFLKLQRDDALTVAVDAAATLFLFLLVTLEIRALFNPEGIERGPALFMERASYVAAWGVFALVALFKDSQAPTQLGTWTWRIAGALALFGAVVMQSLLVNPAFVGGEAGRLPIVNGLILGYAVPALLAGVAAWWLGRSSYNVSRVVAASSSVFLVFVFLTLEVRHFFRRDFAGNPFDAAGTELYVYSVVWLVFGAATMFYGMWRGLAIARHIGMGLVCLTVCKVFLVDMGGLTGLLRVFSFMGLGGALVAMGYLYRRFVFTDAEGKAPPAS